ncbi:RluA family pseudouridine synthase [Thalassotalea euphylliae]|uniref:RluA family pseudouridine synthase n=1 Tax=Thalassotalea euphylliae TaxID=1655234 RepID=UPI003632E2D9
MKTFEIHHHHQGPSEKAIDILKALTDLSTSELKSAISKGALWLEQKSKVNRLRRFKKEVSAGDSLHFYFNEKVLSEVPPTAKLIEDCGNYSVWYKPYGMLAQGSKWSDHCTIMRWAEQHLPNDRVAFPVHRLDRATSGIIVIAHAKKIARAFGKLFETHDLVKQYQAIIHGKLSASPLTSVAPVHDKPAKSTFKELDYQSGTDVSLVEITIETGRKHQIRLHSSSMGHPIVGDRLYNPHFRSHETLNLQLCATFLSFVCPTTHQEKQYTLPNELQLDFLGVAAQLTASN